ncbi:DUF624 domain-containing protein [Corynebacterium choanae]
MVVERKDPAVKGLLDIDGGLYAALQLFAEIVLLNLLMVIGLCSIVCGGAGITASFAVVHTRLNGNSSPLFATFMQALRRTWLRAIAPWLVIVAITLIALWELALLASLPMSLATQAGRALVIVAYLVAVACVVWYCCLLSADVHNASVRELARQAMVTTIVQLPRTALVVLVVIVPVVVAAISLPWALRLVGFYLVVGIGLSVYLQGLATHAVLYPRPESRA